jgi:urease accessory protein
LRKLLPDTGGASLIRDGVLFGRIVARDGFALRGALVPVLTWLNESPLPRTWTL